MKRIAKALIAAVGLVVVGGCAADEWQTQSHELAHAGGWNPPAGIVALADTFSIVNVQAGPWVGPSGCGGQFLEGTRVFRDWIMDNWPQVESIGGYSCRAIANSSSMSVHATGRAVDIMIPTDPAQSRDDSADNDLGDPLANYLLEHAEEFGIQSIIWDNKIWTSSRPPGERFRTYTNTHKHHDHLHVELNPEGAALQTPWFDGPMGPPDLGPCGEPLGPEGGVIDNSDQCFEAYGPSQFWRTETGVGYSGSLRWTNAWRSDEPSNWARWRIDLAEAGRYRLEYHSVGQWAVYDSAQYRVRHAEIEEDVFIDLSAGDDGWQLIGEFDFAAGADQWVAIYDHSAVDIADNQHIIADAIRLVPPHADPVEVDPPELDPPPHDDIVVDRDRPSPGQPGGDTGDSETGDHPPSVIHATGGCATTPSTPGGFWVLALLGLFTFRTRARRRTGYAVG